uniref:Uncharacterized protein n=1 Tax=Plectus sambesii TaxID=2011161 RepID=A0A914WWB4_9BILA
MASYCLAEFGAEGQRSKKVTVDVPGGWGGLGRDRSTADDAGGESVAAAMSASVWSWDVFDLGGDWCRATAEARDATADTDSRAIAVLPSLSSSVLSNAARLRLH